MKERKLKFKNGISKDINKIFKNYILSNGICHINKNEELIDIFNFKEFKYNKNVLSLEYNINNISEIISIKHDKRKKYLNEIKIRYKIPLSFNNKEIMIFNNYFVKNNKRKCKIIYKNKENNLKVKLNVKNYNKEILNIKLKGINQSIALMNGKREYKLLME